MPAQNIQAVLQKLQSLSRLSELPIEEFAQEEGLADSVAQHLRDRLKAAQLRKFYDLLKRVELELRDRGEDDEFPPEFRPRVLRVLPLLAYARGRDNIPHDFYQIMKAVLDFNKIQRVRDYRTLVHFLEAIVAYHKFREPRRG